MTHNNLETPARAALEQITPSTTIGELVSSEQSENIATLHFTSHMQGYAGWEWVVSLAVDGDDTSILETELVAGGDAVIAPDWVPWADRLREYEESLAAGNEVEEVIIASDDEDLDDDDDDEDDLDDEDDDDDEEDDDDFGDDVDEIDLTDVVESRFDDSDVFDGVDEAGSVDDGDDEYVVVEDKD
ncbi:MAG: hypothetical protein RLZZ40_952 [Actinomycetota bacterium]